MTDNEFPEELMSPEEMALAMFDYTVPCIWSITEHPCENQARWLLLFGHDPETECYNDPPLPMCHEHKDYTIKANHPFWRLWFRADPVTCDRCGEMISLETVTPLEPQ